MGNKKCVPIRPITAPLPHEYSRKENEVKIVRSISNPSLQSHVEENEVPVEASVSQQFNEEYMGALYAKFDSAIGPSEEMIPLEIIKMVSHVLETISSDENVFYLASKFGDFILKLDETMPASYLSFAERNPLKYAESRGLPPEKRIVAHNMFVFRSLKVIATAIEEGRHEMAMEILNNLALSHTIMRISKDEFQLLLVRLVKNLIHLKILTDELLGPFVFFSVNIVKYIETSIDDWQVKHDTILGEMEDSYNAPARGAVCEDGHLTYPYRIFALYYRELKKWRIYVLGLYKTLTKQMQAFSKPKPLTVNKEMVTPVDEEKPERWKIIKLLKKGYKYRTKTDMDIF